MTHRPTLAELAKEFLEPGDAATASDPQLSARPQPAAHGQAVTKTTLRLPETIAARLRAWTADTGRTQTDAVLSAYLECLNELRGHCEADTERIRLGLRPLSATVPGGPRVQIVFRAATAALAELDEAAASLALSRNHLATALLNLYLPPSH